MLRSSWVRAYTGLSGSGSATLRLIENTKEFKLNTMSYHIRRDGAWLCKKDKTRSKYLLNFLNEPHVKFTEAHRLGDLKNCCNECKQRYYEILSNMDSPIVI